MQQHKKILVSGASFAGLTAAYWMDKMGYQVTVIEIGERLKMGGTPVDIKEDTVDIVKRMGLFEKIKANRLHLKKIEFKNSKDITEHAILLDQSVDNEYEIERDTLLHMLFDTIKNNVEFIFSTSIDVLKETKGYMDVTFSDGKQRQFDFVFGCDGIHSKVRKIWFGNESAYAHYLGQYFSIAISNKVLIADRTLQLYAEPNKGIMLNSYNSKTDIVFTFRADEEIVYDFRDQKEQKEIVRKQLEGMGWRSAVLQDELLNASNFYFDKFCQIKMPSWTKGKVALVGDAAYCASPAAGMGGSLAIVGATALADAFQKHNGNFQLAFEDYNRSLRPFIDEVQATAIEMLDKLLPKTEEEIRLRNQNGFMF